MQKVKYLLTKIRRKFMKLRLQPIRVLCFHQVSEYFDSTIYCDTDWISLADFKNNIQNLKKEGYQFISLEEAYLHIKHDFIRTRKYVVLTADDGLKCQLNLIPWLEENNIPLTMFLNVETLSGDRCGEPVMKYFNITSKEEEKNHAILYATANEISSVTSPIVTFGLHGIDHRDSMYISKDDFAINVLECQKYLNTVTSTIPVYAYTYGSYTKTHDATLKRLNLIPVYMNGCQNYDDDRCIHRESIK